MTRPAPQPGIMDIALYRGGESSIEGRHDVLKLSANENPYGPNPSAARAFEAASKDLHRYPPTDHRALAEAIAEVHDLEADRIICGVGSDEIIHLLCQAYAGPETDVIHTQHGFAMYKISALAAGARPVEAAETNRTVDVDAILSQVSERTRLVFIANPANPSGTMLGDNAVTRLADAIPSEALLVLDGAYAEFAEGYDGGAELARERSNVIMTRTFSKLYGLGGLRVGWGYGPKEVVDVLMRIRGPFNLSAAQLDAAEAAVRDRDWAEAAADRNAMERARLQAALAAIGIPADRSHTNFLLARFTDAQEARSADAHLRDAGIIVRYVAGYGFPECLRITIGKEDDNDRVIAALTAFKEAQ